MYPILDFGSNDSTHWHLALGWLDFNRMGMDNVYLHHYFCHKTQRRYKKRILTPLIKNKDIKKNYMGVNTIEQDFADRHIKYFGKQHFGFLTKVAKKYGVGRCDSLVSEMKHEKDLPVEVRIRWFTKVINVKR